MRTTINGTAITFVGNYYEVSGSTVTKYYYAGSQRIAMSVGGTVYYLLSDQLGSATMTVKATTSETTELRYGACPLRCARGCFARAKCGIAVEPCRPTTPTPGNIRTWPTSG